MTAGGSGRGYLVALAVGVVLLELWASVGAASASGPVPPSFTDPLVVSAVSDSGFQGQNAYLQVPREIQSVKVHAFVSGPNVGLRTAWVNETNATPRGSVLTGGVVWINVTATCGANSCPGASVSCDGLLVSGFLSPPSFRVNRPCWALGILFNNELLSSASDQAPNYTATRQETFLTLQGTQWFSPSKTERTTVANLSILEASAFGAKNLTSYSVPAAAWSVPYPAGNWNPSQTQVSYTNLSTAVTNFSQTPKDVVMRWAGIPPGIQNYTVSVFGNPGGSFGQGYSNQTVPTTLVLFAGNVTNLGGGTFSSSVQWTNPYSQSFNGTVQITGAWVPTATEVKVYVNAQPVQAVWTSTAITLTSGTANVSGGSSVVIQISYVPTSAFSFWDPVFYINDLGVNWPEIAAAVGGAALVVATFGGLTGRVRMAAMASAAIGLLTGLGWVWLAL